MDTYLHTFTPLFILFVNMYTNTITITAQLILLHRLYPNNPVLELPIAYICYALVSYH